MVKRFLSQQFRLAWTNIEGDPSAGSSYAHKPQEPMVYCLRGNGEHNVQMLVCDPKGRLVHAFAGYLNPKALIEELSFAVKLLGKLRSTKELKNQKKLIAKTHKEAEAKDKTRQYKGALATFIKNRLTADHKYCRRHPLMPASNFEASEMVGRSMTFFGSSNGQEPQERIGFDPTQKKSKPEQDKNKKSKKFRGKRKNRTRVPVQI